MTVSERGKESGVCGIEARCYALLMRWAPIIRAIVTIVSSFGCDSATMKRRSGCASVISAKRDRTLETIWQLCDGLSISAEFRMP